jgi:hypothetical protein
LMLQCAGDVHRVRQALNMVNAAQYDRDATSWYSLNERMNSHSIALAMRLARLLVRV